MVLAGSTLGGCGSPVEQRDTYQNMQSCVQDWGDPALCEPVRDGRYASSYAYGPPYYAHSGWSLFGRDRIQPSPRAWEASRLPPGTVARSPLAAAAARRGISGGGSSSVSRGGFGSSGRSFSFRSGS